MMKTANKNKCTFPGGITYRPDGKNEIDPCQYELIEKHRNVTVEVLRCKKCGHVEISWIKNDECDSFDPRTNEPLYGTYEDREGE